MVGTGGFSNESERRAQQKLVWWSVIAGGSLAQMWWLRARAGCHVNNTHVTHTKTHVLDCYTELIDTLGTALPCPQRPRHAYQDALVC